MPFLYVFAGELESNMFLEFFGVCLGWKMRDFVMNFSSSFWRI